jgi:hypothetical protein
MGGGLLNDPTRWNNSLSVTFPISYCTTRGRLADKHVAWANVVLFLHSYAPSDPHQQADELRRFISLPQLYQASQTGVDSTIPQVLEINVIDVWKARTLWQDGCKEAEVEVLLR